MGVSAARVTGRRGCCFSAVGLLAQPTLPRRALRGAASGRFGRPACCGEPLDLCGFASDRSQTSRQRAPTAKRGLRGQGYVRKVSWSAPRTGGQLLGFGVRTCVRMTRGAAFRSLLDSHDRSGRFKINREPARFVRVPSAAATAKAEARPGRGVTALHAYVRRI